MRMRDKTIQKRPMISLQTFWHFDKILFRESHVDFFRYFILISLNIIKGLYVEHSETLVCPCSTATIPYKDFVSNTITFHPVCSSIFVSQQWIEALYFPNASMYGVTDFRTTAKSQVS
jgi:hypothetical protein